MPSRRRPPRDALGVNRILGLAAAAFLIIPCLVDAQQPQQQQQQQQLHPDPSRPSVPLRQESYHEAHEARRLEVTKLAQPLETPTNPRRRKDTLSVNQENNQNIEASAIATFAPGKSAVEPPLSQHIARNLEDWEVEDFVLLATIDGKLHARDRKTGKERWNIHHEKPMVETKYHRRGRSAVEEDYQRSLLDDYVWIVEPSRDGSLYYYNPAGPDRGLINTGLTMKKIVDEMSPYRSQDPDVSYTGTKTTSMVTIDAITGDVIKFFGIGGNLVNGGKCIQSNALLDNGECSPNATLSIGRTEYTVAIQDGKTGDQIATLTFSEWTPNNYDQDLTSQYSKTLDEKYIYASHDGSIIGLDHAINTANEPGKLFQHKFSSPVVRVFDVARPWGTDKVDPELVVLPQPMPPDRDHEEWLNHPLKSIFLNHTEDGSWYAMSGKSYPYAVQGIKLASCNQQGWLSDHPAWDVANDLDLHEALVGLHSIDYRKQQERLRTISAPVQEENQSSVVADDNSLGLPEPSTLAKTIQALPEKAAIRIWDFFTNPFLIVFISIWLITYRSRIILWLRENELLASTKQIEKAIAREAPISIEPVTEAKIDPLVLDPSDREVTHEEVTIDVPVEPTTPLEPLVTKPEKPQESEKSGEEAVVEGESPVTASSDADKDKPAASPEKKKAHRGRRGGVKHRKGPKSADKSSDEQPKPAPTVDDAVRNAQNLGQQPKLEPDIKTLPSDPSEVSGPILRIGALEVNTEKLIGTGSNGTLVFEGNFDGRAVAVKRMLIQFFDIASHETKLLRESDDHENVIRYYAQQQAAEFLYIALELCPASLAEVIEKPEKHRELAQKGEKDLPQVLYQITNGIRYLHSLRIVHRDLKPQNILVTTHKDGRPRLLVSDFGLCKKLEGEQSSFRATTAHAAGTSGWRAPELLLDDDARDGMAMVDASTEGHSGPLMSGDLPPNRRATRAIDIFSLGLVFFYVLTKGSHPYDCGDRYMREVNIRKGVFKLDQLDVLGDYAYEAKDLVRSMLNADPRQRPLAHHVLAHPFFWNPKKRLNFLCDVSDHFEKEKRDPPSEALLELESHAAVCGGDFLKPLGREFVDSLGKQRKYTGNRLLDLLRALRNKKNHYEDMSDHLKEVVGPLPEGYLSFWTRRFPTLLIECWNVVYDLQWDNTDRFREYYEPPGANMI